MEYSWNVDGIFMEDISDMYGRYKGYVWNIDGIYGRYMGYCHKRGFMMAYVPERWTEYMDYI